MKRKLRRYCCVTLFYKRVYTFSVKNMLSLEAGERNSKRNQQIAKAKHFYYFIFS